MARTERESQRGKYKKVQSNLIRSPDRELGENQGEQEPHLGEKEGNRSGSMGEKEWTP